MPEWGSSLLDSSDYQQNSGLGRVFLASVKLFSMKITVINGRSQIF